MDAGNFSNLNFGNIGPSRFQKAPGPSPNQENTREIEDKGPRESVDLNSLPFLEVNQELLPADAPIESITAGGLAPGKTAESFNLSGPLMVDSVSGVNSQSFNTVGTGITALNGINSTSLFTLGGKTIASLSPFNPTAATRMPTTSVSAYGIESTSFMTSSGRVIDLGSPQAVKMPTTSVTTFGLEDSSWLTTSGRTIAL